MVTKVKVWIEDGDSNLVFGSGKSEILEYIDKTGSISDASKQVGMNYKKAWNHIKILQEYIEDDLTITTKGSSGGTVLTPKAKDIIQKFKILHDDVNAYAKQRFDELFKVDGEDILKVKND
ncbi:MAG: molybdenum transporter [Arcobacteraceae bacterium]|jgi:molybdate transport repressor ModE-like protein|nr:LysR family transcriptional regulator [Arcobacteraceae bacterium]